MLFNGNGPLAIQVSSGTTTPLFSAADTVVNGSTSRVIAPLDSGAVGRTRIVFTTNGFGATIFGSNTPPTSAGPQNGVSAAVLTAGQSLSDQFGYAFYWAVAAASGPGSVIAHVS
jgi:hypothetical protein